MITIEQLYSQIAALGKKYQVNKIVLFGSRARGNNRERSGIDIAVYGMPEKFRGLFWSAIDELPTLLSVDIVHISEKTDPALIHSIERDGIVLMNKAEEIALRVLHGTNMENSPRISAGAGIHRNQQPKIRYAAGVCRRHY